MRICFVADGRTDHSEVFANYFASRKHEVHLISPNFSNGYRPEVMKHKLTHFVPWTGTLSRYLSFWTWMDQVKKIVSRLEVDIINAHFITAYGFLASRTDFHPLVVTAWGSDVLVQPRKSVLWRYIVKSVLQKADLLTCLFDAGMVKSAIGDLLPHGLPLASLPHGIDTNLFKKQEMTAAGRLALGIGEADPVIINTRGAHPIFDPLTYLKAVPSVVSEIPQARFLFTCQKEYKRAFEEAVEGLGVKNNVIILDWLPNQEVARYLALADIFVSPSLSDGASNALFEGMACELAPVVTDIPANRDWIKNGENGLLFEPGNHASLADKISSLINETEKRKIFGKRCRELVRERAEQKIQMAKTEALYQDLINAKKRHHGI